MSKYLILSVLIAFFSISADAQCDTSLMQISKGKLLSSLHTSSDSASYAFNDLGNSWKSTSDPIQEVVYQFDAITNLNGIFISTLSTSKNKPSHVQLFTSKDSIDWKEEMAQPMNYLSDDDTVSIAFGTVEAIFVKVVFTSSSSIHIQRIKFYEDSCRPTGKRNAIIDFSSIGDAYLTVGSIDLIATEKYGNDISFSIIEGNATISGQELIANGTGRVVVAASTKASSSFYPTQVSRVFNLYNPKDYPPENTLSITGAFPLELNAWESYPIYMHSNISDILQEYKIIKEQLFIDGDEVTLIADGNYSYYLWHPGGYQEYEIKYVTEADNGEITTTTEIVTVKKGAENQQVTTLEDVVIWFGRENSRVYEGNYQLPQHVGVYNKITAHLDVACPNGNCDDWDRWAYIDIKAPDGNWIQLIRYITPYGVACDHSIDLTQYASLLQGNVEIRVFIDTWGTGGWQLTLDLDYEAGRPDFFYSNVVEIWDGAFDFGNPSNLQPIDSVKLGITDDVAQSDLYVSTTGHGWGENNTSNAAEFYNATHAITVNGQAAFQQNLWNNCNPNPDGCSGQNGSWQHNRAGWCPGAISEPDMYELYGVTAKDSFYLDYVFQTFYVDKCHPNDPSCRSGVTCKDCNAGYNPHYQVDVHQVNYSNKPLVYNGSFYTNIDQVYALNLDMEVFPNPTNQAFQILSEAPQEPLKILIRSLDGKTHATYCIENGDDLKTKTFDVSSLKSGLYFVEIQGKSVAGVQSLVVK